MHKNNLLLFKLFRIYLMPINKELNTHCTSTYIGYVCVCIYIYVLFKAIRFLCSEILFDF